MLKARFIPCLLLRNQALVKTVQFKSPQYVGDPINTVRIFNQKEVDELVFLDITATPEKKEPPFELLSKIAAECFMPFAYGGGIQDLETARKIFNLGVEKVIVNTKAIEEFEFVTELSKHFGSQSIVVSIDVKRSLFGRYKVYTQGGRKAVTQDPIELAIEMEKRGAGEILLTSINRDGTWKGYDLNLIENVAKAVQIPVIASGGAGCVDDFSKGIHQAGASAVAAGSMVVYQAKGRGVLINFPKREQLDQIAEMVHS